MPKITNILSTVVILALVGGIYACAQMDNTDKEKQKTLEIIDKDYYAIKLKLDYIEGSEAGAELKRKIKTALQDGQITRAEFKNIMKDDATIYAYHKPEEKVVVEKAKQQIIDAVKH
jgi:hypothetical protein